VTNPTGADARSGPQEARAWILWHRAGAGRAWRAAGTYVSEAAANDAIRGGGDWYVGAPGQNPNDRRPPRRGSRRTLTGDSPG
jgi:hypothetical protein